MELLNPAGLLWLGALPLLLLPYLVRERPRRHTVPALFLYQGIDPAKRIRLGGRPRLERLFLLQLLLLLAAIAAIARPVWNVTETRSAIVLDNSASLRARDGSGQSRFEIAKRRAREAIEQEEAGLWDLYLVSPHPVPIARSAGRREALERIEEIDPGNCPHPEGRSLEDFFERLAQSGYSSIHVVTDRSGEPSRPFEIHTVGEPVANLAITSFAVTPAGFTSPASMAIATVGNYSAEATSVRIAIEDAKSGEKIATGTLEIPAGGSSSYSAPIKLGRAVRARLDTRDALAEDDEALAEATPRRKRSVLVVSSRPSGLESIRGLRVATVTPPDYVPTLAAEHDLVIFHLAAPLEPPPAPALYLLPPDASFLPPAKASVAETPLAFPRPVHPIVRYVSSGALRPRRSLVFGPSSGWESLVITADGPVLLARENGRRSVVSGIDLLPYLGERNRSISILTLNLLSWLGGDGRAEGGTGSCSLPGAGDSDLRGKPALRFPPEQTGTAAAQVAARPLWPLLALLALAVLAIEAWLERRQPGAWPSSLPAQGLRLVVAGLLALSAFDPARAVPGPPVDPTIAVDVSGSVPSERRAEKLQEVSHQVSASAPVVAFAAKPVPTEFAALGRFTPADTLRDAGDQDTDLEAALIASGSRMPEGASLLLLTDGWETRGEAKRAIDFLRNRRIRVYPISLAAGSVDNVAVERLSLPAESLAGRSARAEVLLRNESSRAASGRLTLRQGDRVLHRETVRLPSGESLVARPVLISGPGLLDFSATLDGFAAEDDRFADDDVARAWVGTGSRKQALLLGRSRSANRYLLQGLGGRGFTVASVSLGAGEPVPDLRGFGAVILNDVALDDLPRGIAAELRDAVRSGTGLVMVGGAHSFGLGGYLGSPIEEALPVRMKPREREETRSSVALVIDKSGSMREERRMSYAREAARELALHLDDRDRLTVIGFDREPFVVIPLSRVGDVREGFEERIRRLKPAGGTRLYPALVEAERQLLGEEARRRHIIVLSDGLSEDAESAEGRRRYYDLALALVESHVTMSTIALGSEADEDFLERLASYGRGAFHATIDPSSLPEILLGEIERPGKEKTLVETEIRPSPSPSSPVVGELARSPSRWPAVLGLVETEIKRGARLDVGSSAPGQPPLIASWQYGAGRSAVVTTDADGRWSDRWVRWGEWSRLWAGILRWLVPESEDPKQSVAMAYHEGALAIEYSRFLDDPAEPLSARVTAPGGLLSEIPMARIAPGHYRAAFPTREPGNFRIELRGPRGPITRPPLGYTVTSAINAERPRPEPDWALLDEIARATGGKVDPKPGEIAAVHGTAETIPLAPQLLPAAVFLFIADLVTRRLGQRKVG